MNTILSAVILKQRNLVFPAIKPNFICVSDLLLHSGKSKLISQIIGQKLNKSVWLLGDKTKTQDVALNVLKIKKFLLHNKSSFTFANISHQSSTLR